MASAHEELIRELFERWNSGDREIDAATIAQDAEIHSAMTNSTYHGYGGIKDWMVEIDDQFDSWQLSIDEIRELGEDRLLTLGKVHIRGRSSGIEFDQEVAWVFVFRGRKVVEMTAYPDQAEALRVVGAHSP